MTLYVSSKPQVSILDALVSESPKTSKGISQLYAQALTCQNFKKKSQIFTALGLSSSDKSGHKVMDYFLSFFEDKSLVTSTALSVEHPDITRFFPKENPHLTLGYFKLGAKRASLELAARKIGLLMGLSEATPPGLFAALKDPCMHTLIDESEELWSGLDKCYLEPKVTFEEALEKECAAYKAAKKGPSIGIRLGLLTPSAGSFSKTLSSRDLWIRTLFSLAIGLQDGKEDNFIGPMLIDGEEIMPPWHKPSKTHPHIACHLPFLDCKEALTPVSPEDLIWMKELAGAWKIEKIIKALKQEKIFFYDPIAEGKPAEWTGKDSGGYFIKLEPSLCAVPHPDIKKHPRLFTKFQLTSFRKRLSRLKRAIVLSTPMLTPLQLVKLVIPGFREALDLFPRKRGDSETSPLRELGSPVHFRGSPYLSKSSIMTKESSPSPLKPSLHLKASWAMSTEDEGFSFEEEETPRGEGGARGGAGC